MQDIAASSITESVNHLNPSSSPSSLDQVIIHGQWNPPVPWSEIDIDHDGRQWVESLVAHGLLPKATSAVTCQRFFRRILEFSNHWTRVGKTTCHLFTCRNCGTGKMRAHRLWMTDPKRYTFITDQYSSTFRLVIRHESACDTLADYRSRIEDDRHHVAALWRRIRKKFRDVGFIRSVELDPKMRYVAFRLYCAGTDIRYAWMAKHWLTIVGQSALTEDFHYDDAAKALRWTLAGVEGVLMFPGTQRADWEQAFEGFRFAASVGILRGAKLDDGIADLPQSDDPDAPHGRCPCGCGGAIIKSPHHDPMTFQNLESQYAKVEVGTLRTYSAYRPKAESLARPAYRIPLTVSPVATSPPH